MMCGDQPEDSGIMVDGFYTQLEVHSHTRTFPSPIIHWQGQVGQPLVNP